jgi:acyl transferase domain-containing protein/glutamate-1-semialdehyde aminotransferase
MGVERAMARTGNEIAIIGMAGRFPRARDIHEFWANLRAGVECSTSITAEDLRSAGVDPAVLNAPDYVSEVFALDDAEHFDAGFFGFSPREAEYLDPQHRILLETAATALDHAGYDPDRYEGLIGVFAGVGRNSYFLNALARRPELFETAGEYHALIGSERDFPTTHVSYRLNLRGPSVDVQTACSTSGVAVHLACQSLRAGDCDIALAGGAKIIAPNRVGYHYVEGGPLAPEGHIRAFDAKANGMVRGSGAAIVVLKRLEDAIADGDGIHAIIIGSAVNNDGGAKIGFTAPSVSGQADVIADALMSAGVTADDISYVEAHGTGTLLGDPIEIAGLTEAFRRSTDRTSFCRIGSVKTNIGHLDAGATAAGILKTVLSLRHQELPPSINCATPNPGIDWENSPVIVNTSLSAWPRSGVPRRAGVSSFGLGGTNAHIVLEEAPASAPSPADAGAQLLVLSARSQESLDVMTRSLAEHLDNRGEDCLADIAFTLQVGRREWTHRRAVVSASPTEAARAFRHALERSRAEQMSPVSASPAVAFVCPGAGAQYRGMASELYVSEPAFKNAMDSCLDAVDPELRARVHEFVIAPEGTAASHAIQFCGLVATQYSLASLWRHWGVTPSVLVGDGLGEYAAAALAGVIGTEDMFRLAVARGAIFDCLPPDAMVPCPEPDLRDLVDDATTLRLGLAARVEFLDGALDGFNEVVRGISFQQPCVRIVSCVPGPRPGRDAVATPDYWTDQVRRQSRSSEALATLFHDPNCMLLELGPSRLSALARKHPVRRSHGVANALTQATVPGGNRGTLLRAVADLWCAGVSVDWPAIHATPRRRVELPTYPFSRQRYSLLTTPPAPVQRLSPEAAPATSAIHLATQPPNLSENTGMTAPSTERSDSRADRLCRELKRILHELSGIDEDRIDTSATFLELGFDSLFLAEANAAFKKRFGVRITTRQLMEKTPTLAGLAAHLDAVLPTDAFGVSAPALVTSSANQSPATNPDTTVQESVTAGSSATSLRSLETLIAQQMQLMQAQLAAVQSAVSSNGSRPSPSAPAAPPMARSETPQHAAPDKTSPWQPVTRTNGQSDLTPDQQVHLDALLERVTRRTPKSKALTQHNRPHLSDPRTVQGFRKPLKEIVYPLVSDRAEGSRIWDVDGNEYIDLVNGYGVTFFGHSPKFVTDAIAAQLAKSVAIGPQTPLAGEVAKLVCELTGHERAAFCNTGSEAVLAGIRMARTVTGKTKIGTFAGHYHGIFDEVLGKAVGGGAERRAVPQAPGIPSHALTEVVVFDYDNPASLDAIRKHADELAIVMVEPVRSRNLDRQPREFLRALRQLTEELGIPLLFDEMITGFRSHPGGAQALFGVKADIATYGKVIGGGLPIGVVAGKARFLDALDGGAWQYGDDSSPEADMTWFAGTFVRHPLALAAAKAALSYLKDAGPELQGELNRRTARFAAELNQHFRTSDTPIHIEQFASSFFVTFTSHQEHSSLLFYHLRNRGIYTYEGRPAFFTLAHSDSDMAAVAAAFKESVAELQSVGLLAGGVRRDNAIRVVPLAEGQQEIWLATRFGVDASRAFNLANTLRLRGSLRIDALQAALQQLVQRHEALRAIPNEDGVSQRILPSLTLAVPVIDLSALPAAERDRRLSEIREGEVETAFDLTAGPLTRATLIKLGPDDHYLILAVHHIVCDGWSCGVLLRDLGKLYEAECTGRSAQLSPAMQLSEFAAASLANRESAERAAAEEYWLGEFAGPIPTLALPTDRARPPRKTFRARRITLPLEESFAIRVKRLAAAHESTLFSTLLAGFAALLHRLSDQTDVVVGFSLAGQAAITDRDLVGHCVTFLPLRLQIEPQRAVREFMGDVRGKVLDAVDNQNLAFGALLRRLRIARDPSRVPLMSVAFNVDPSGRNISFHDLQVENGSVGRRFENFDIFFNVVELGGDRLEIQCTFNLDLFDERTMWNRLRQYIRLMDSATEAPDLAIADLVLDVAAAGADGLAVAHPTGQVVAPTTPVVGSDPTGATVTPKGVTPVVEAAWHEVLGLHDIAHDADFFEIGGHSLLGAQVIMRIRERLGLELTLATLFEAPTITHLSNRIEALQYLDGINAPDGEREVVEL